ncbi:hypothetical protein Plhal304r1_c024g0083011 [Plasmopara halstedii]
MWQTFRFEYVATPNWKSTHKVQILDVHYARQDNQLKLSQLHAYIAKLKVCVHLAELLRLVNQTVPKALPVI